MRRLLLLGLTLAATPAISAPQRCAHITAGVVDNVVLADPAMAPAGVDCSNPAAQIGWTFADGVYTPPPPAPPVYQTSALDFLQFMALFTTAEQAAIVSSGDTQVRLFLLMATGAARIDLDDARVTGGVNYLAARGLIAPGRVAVILSGAQP